MRPGPFGPASSGFWRHRKISPAIRRIASASNGPSGYVPSGSGRSGPSRACVRTPRHGELIAEALAEAGLAEVKSRDEIEERLAGVRQQIAGARRAIDRYFAAFEEGSLSPSDCQERIGMLRERIEALEAEERQLSQEATFEPSEAVSAEEAAEWASTSCSGSDDLPP
jgi:uncharacterized small protein (DUF1192 family)